MKLLRALTFTCLVGAGVVLKAQAPKEPVKDPFEFPWETLARTNEAFRIVPDAKGRAYFPEGEAHFYTKYLAAMKEPSVMAYEAGDPEFAVRFIWLRWRHDPIVVRLWSDGHDPKVRAVRLAAKEDGSPGPISKDMTRKLTPEEWKEILRLADPAEFWKPVTHEEQEVFDNGNDGAFWIFEKRTPAKYEALDLWCPKAVIEYLEDWKKQPGEKPPKFRDLAPYVQLGQYLLKITGLTPADAREIY